MATSKRPSLWYQSWTSGTSQEPAKSVRKAIARELLQAIKDNDYDAQTLEEINLVLDYEYLCRKLQDSPKLKPKFESAIGISMVGDFADHLSSCLVKLINTTSYFERALQCRALVSVFALVQLHGVKAQQTESYTRWQEQLKGRFKDLVWLPDETTKVSSEVFYKMQCSYLLCLGWGYAQRFVRAEPKSTAGVAIAMDIMQLGVVAVTTALGSGCANLGTSLQDLDSNFTRLLQSPDCRYHDLFELQGLTRIAVALQLFSRSGARSTQSSLHCDDLNTRALETSERIAVAALRQILGILTLADNAHFETAIRHPSRVWDQWLALLNRGPAKLDKYNYFYGLLDCASQLAGFLEPAHYPSGLELRMKSIIRRSCEVNFRWKAMEVLLSHPNSRSQRAHMILAETDPPNLDSSLPSRKQLLSEISVVSECLRGDSSSDSMSQPASPTPEVMCLADWIEEPTCAYKYSSQAQSFQISLPRGHFYKRTHFLAAGLSTRCSYAYFLNDEMILIYSLSEDGGKPGEKPIFQKRASGAKYHAAALSERFVVVLTGEAVKKTIQVFRYDEELIGSHTYGVEANEYQWNASDLVTITETNDRTWIAVGGCVKQDGNMTGSIKMHCIDEIGGSATLSRYAVSFNRPRPNPLALDLLRTLDFSPDGKRLVCATTNHRVLVWRLSNNKRPSGPPFEIKRNISHDIKGGRISSVSLFNSPLCRPYLLCTTMPSRERVINRGEWSFVSPVGSGPIRVHEKLVRDLTRLKKAEHIFIGAVAPHSNAVALLKSDGKDQGRLVIMPLAPEIAGGFSTLEPILLNAGTLRIRDSDRRSVSSTAIRFCPTTAGFALIAVDIEGGVLKNYFTE